MNTLTDKINAFYLDAIGFSAPVEVPDAEPTPLDEQFGYHSPIGWTAPAETPDPEPSPTDTGERIALADLIRAQVTKFRSWNNEAGDLFASHFEELASEAAFLGAHTAAEFHDHRAILLVD